MKEFLTFDDIQIIPIYSEILSRDMCNISTRFTKNFKINIPIISAPMDTVTSGKMAIEISKLGGVGCVHRFMSIDDQIKEIQEIVKNIKYPKTTPICASIGVKDYEMRLDLLIKNGTNVILIDVAHGNTLLVKNTINYIKKNYDVDIIAGNVATFEGAKNLCKWGVDAIRCGIGNGCFTPNMEVKTKNGLKKISDIKINDYVYTHKGELNKVIDILIFDKNEEIMIINDIECTKNHKFFVIDKSDLNKINNDKDIEKYGLWLESSKLNSNYLLVEIKNIITLKKYELKEIEKIEKKYYNGKVYDLTIKNHHSYNINGIIVHNSVCETRIRSGIGIPQVTAIMDCVKACKEYDVPIIADGGIRLIGDIAKALSLGADTVMLGSLLSGTKESPGNIQKIGKWPNEQLYKKYRGSASLDTKISNNISEKNIEGNSTLVPYKGKIKRLISDICDGLKSSMSYTNSLNLDEFKKNSKFIKITQSGIIEAKPHLLK